MMAKVINLKEWDSIVLDGIELSDSSARNSAKILTEKGILEIIEIKGGLSIRSNSYVGRVKLGDLQINMSEYL
jgi:5-methylcytosine-specific restriction enzyme subunit McrC